MANKNYTKVDITQLNALANSLKKNTSSVSSNLTNYKNKLSSIESSQFLEGVSVEAINTAYDRIMGIYNKFSEYSADVLKEINEIVEETQNIDQEANNASEDIINADPLSFGTGILGTAVNNLVNGGTNSSGSDSDSPSTNPTSNSGSVDSEINAWLEKYEGNSGTTTINGKEYYEAYSDGGGKTCPRGVQVVSAEDGETKYCSKDSYIEKDGKLYVEKSAVDNLYVKEVNSKKNAVLKAAEKYNVNLTEEQLVAATSHVYRRGIGKGQADELIAAYAENGNAGVNTYMSSHAGAAINRTEAEITLFTAGEY